LLFYIRYIFSVYFAPQFSQFGCKNNKTRTYKIGNNRSGKLEP